jgi:hypothetical protein
MLPSILLPVCLCLVFSTFSKCGADTSFSEAAASAHLDRNLESLFLATSNILIEAKTLSHFTSQRHAEMSAHISNGRHTISSSPIASWVEVMKRFADQVSVHNKSVKKTALEILESVEENEQAAYHVLQILEFTDNIAHILSRLREQTDKQLVVQERTDDPSEALEEDENTIDQLTSTSTTTIDSRRMHDHWRMMRKEADNIVHEAKRIKKSLIILKDSGGSGRPGEEDRAAEL